MFIFSTIGKFLCISSDIFAIARPFTSLYGHRTAEFSSGELVEKKINGGNPAVPSNDEISPGVSWRISKAALYPFNPSAIA